MNIKSTIIKEQQKTYYTAKIISIAATSTAVISLVNFLGAYKAYNLACTAMIQSIDKFAELSMLEPTPLEYQNESSMIDKNSKVEYRFSETEKSITIPENARKIISESKLHADNAMFFFITAITTASFIYFDPFNLDFSDQHLCELAGIDDNQCQSLIDYTNNLYSSAFL